MWQRWLGRSLALVLLLAAPGASADGASGERVRLLLLVDPAVDDCPAPRTLARRITAVTGTKRFSPDGAVTAVVAISRHADQLVAELSYRGPGGTLLGRRTLGVEGRSCRALVRPLVVAIGSALRAGVVVRVVDSDGRERHRVVFEPADPIPEAVRDIAVQAVEGAEPVPGFLVSGAPEIATTSKGTPVFSSSPVAVRERAEASEAQPIALALATGASAWIAGKGAMTPGLRVAASARRGIHTLVAEIESARPTSSDSMGTEFQARALAALWCIGEDRARLCPRAGWLFANVRVEDELGARTAKFTGFELGTRAATTHWIGDHLGLRASVEAILSTVPIRFGRVLGQPSVDYGQLRAVVGVDAVLRF